MGKFYMFKCKKCDYEYEINIGFGFRLFTAPHNELYVCQCCGKWKLIKIPPLVPNVDDFDSERDIPNINMDQFKCDYCGTKMEEIEETDNLSSLSCPKCGTENETIEILIWD